MNISKKSKIIKTKTKKKNVALTKEKMNIILDPAQWTGSSNWAQFAKAAGIKIKKKDSKDSLADYDTFMSKNPNFIKPNVSLTIPSNKNSLSNEKTTEPTSNLSEAKLDKSTKSNKNFNTQSTKTSKGKQDERKGILKLQADATERNKAGQNSTEKFMFNFKNEDFVSNDATNGFSLVPEKSAKIGSKKITKVIAMDCEMVGTGPHGEDSIIARVSIVNSEGDCLYDEFVKPKEHVTDYRTKISGVRPSDLVKGKELFEVQKDVSSLMEGKILVGHSIKNDFDVLFLSHPRSRIRDTSRYKPFRKLCGGSTPSLKKLVNLVLGAQIQTGEHSSVEDAQATMQLYMMHRHEWEKGIKDARCRFQKKNVTQSQNSKKSLDAS